jgi:hypothetical protein
MNGRGWTEPSLFGEDEGGFALRQETWTPPAAGPGPCAPLVALPLDIDDEA